MPKWSALGSGSMPEVDYGEHSWVEEGAVVHCIKCNGRAINLVGASYFRDEVSTHLVVRMSCKSKDCRATFHMRMLAFPAVDDEVQITAATGRGE